MEVRYVEIPGNSTLELPPLLVRGVPEDTRPREELVSMAAEIVSAEDLLPDDAETAPDARRMDMALHLTDQYFGLVTMWQWGDSVVEWIRQCEITFETNPALRPLLHRLMWPHAGRSSFVDLLVQKEIQTHGIRIPDAVGTRLTFRQPPPIACCTDHFLFFLKSSIANSAYEKWASMNVDRAGQLPPERFHFDVLEM